MKKKGISPLIATVLIIGFTVALAAIIITWSTGFTKKMQTQTEETANVQVVCATDVVFGIKSVCYETDDTECGSTTTNCYKVLIQNDGKEKITNWRIRLYKNENEVDSNPTIEDPPAAQIPLDAFGIKLYTFTPSTASGITEVRKVEVFPEIMKGGKPVVCSQNVDSFGDASSLNAITEAC